MRPNTTCSAARPASSMVSWSSSSCFVARKRSSEGRLIVKPSAAPVGMIVILCTALGPISSCPASACPASW